LTSWTRRCWALSPTRRASGSSLIDSLNNPTAACWNGSTPSLVTFAAQGDWRQVVLSLVVGLLFGYAMKNSGLWLAERREKQRAAAQQSAMDKPPFPPVTRSEGS